VEQKSSSFLGVEQPPDAAAIVEAILALLEDHEPNAIIERKFAIALMRKLRNSPRILMALDKKSRGTRTSSHAAQRHMRIALDYIIQCELCEDKGKARKEVARAWRFSVPSVQDTRRGDTQSRGKKPSC